MWWRRSCRASPRRYATGATTRTWMSRPPPTSARRSSDAAARSPRSLLPRFGPLAALVSRRRRRGRAPDESRNYDAELVEKPQRHREHHLRDHVRRREYRSDHERPDDHVRTDLFQFFYRDHADPHQHDHCNRDLEGHTERDEGSEGEGQVLLDIGHP